MKIFLWTAAITAVTYAVLGPILLAQIGWWSGAPVAGVIVDPHPWLAFGPWSMAVWSSGDMAVEFGLYAATVVVVCLVIEAWRAASSRQTLRPTQRLTPRHQL